MTKHAGVDSTYLNAEYNNVTKTLRSITYDECQIIEGYHYFIKTYVDLDGEADTDRFLFTVPATTRIFAKVAMWASAAFTVSIYENTTTSNDGTPITAFNNNRNSTRTAELAPFAGPTVTTEGTLIWTTKIDATKESSGVAAGTNYFIYVKQSTKYMFKIVKTAAGTGFVDFDFWWVEQEVV